MITAEPFTQIDRALAGPFGTAPLSKFLVDKGTRWQGSSLPPDISKAPSRQCYRNAWNLSLSRELRYCEGYAWDLEIGLRPFQHAWNLCPRSGRVIDATWNIGVGAIYLGIQIAPMKLASIINRTQRFSIFETGCGFDYKLVEELWNWRPTPSGHLA